MKIQKKGIKMPHCEMCGKATELVSCVIEGCEMSVCGACVRYGTVTAMPASAAAKSAAFKKAGKTEKAGIEEAVVADSALKVKNARESKKLTQEQLAKAIAEKESVIHRIESGNMVPSIPTAKKLERFLDIKLVEIVEEEKAVIAAPSSEGFTIGDLLVKRK